jgi:hypothetical protein
MGTRHGSMPDSSIADTDTDTDGVGSRPARVLGVVTGGC